MSLNGQNQERGVVEYQARDGQKIKLSPAIIKKYLVSGKAELVTDQELYLYMGLCKSRGLNPFIRDCHLVKYTPGDPAAVITSIDYYRKRARAQEDCRGWKIGIVIQGKEGEPKYREGCILQDGEKLLGGWAEAKPNGWDFPMRREVNLNRYIKKTKEGRVTLFWQPDNQPEMIAKVAESQLLRSVWPDEFQGLYVDAEVQSRDAQDELHAAVGTSSGGDPELEAKFAEAFAEQAKDSQWDQFVQATANTYAMDLPAIKARMINQVRDVIDGFAAWKHEIVRGAAHKAEAKAGLDANSDQEGQKSEEQEGGVPGDTGEESGAEKVPPTNEESQAAELRLLQAEIKRLEKVDADAVRTAKANKGIALTVTPQTIDGCNVLIDEIKELQRHRAAKPQGRGRK